MKSRLIQARRHGLTLLTVATALVGAVASAAAYAAEPVVTSDAKANYLKEKARCDSGQSAQDKATCLKEAGAALDEKKKGKLDNSGSPAANATDRCNVLPSKDKADCLSRINGAAAPNQRVTTSGSVSGGGVIKETTTTTPGAVIVLQPAPTPTPAPRPASAP